MTAFVCFCACPDAAVAGRIADALVAEQLAACVNVLPGLRSVYRWQGRMQCTDEVLLLIKTTRERVDGLGARIRALHPYELPELVAVEVAGGLAAYLAWIHEAVADASAPKGD